MDAAGMDYAAEVPDGADVLWTPTVRQSEFLACGDYEVLFGGAAGGGKTDALLIDAMCLQHDGLNHPQHRAVIFRKTYKDLRDIIDRSQTIYPAVAPGAVYNKTEHVWTFPSGAKIEFGHLQHDADRYNYRGRAWNYIAFEELTLWFTPLCWEYLRSRNRTVAKDLPCYMRATTNPDGIGQKWVMEYWGIEESGDATRQSVILPKETLVNGQWVDVDTKVWRSFIPAKLAENPHLRGSGYRERLLMLPPEEREALLHGMWRGNRVDGAYYFKEMQRARAEGRITRVPFLKDIPVNTYWDLGFNDTTAIWFHQKGGLEHRFPMAYENSGEDIAFYSARLQEIQREHDFPWGTFYLPHDATHGSLQTGKKTIQQLLKEQLPGQRFEIVSRVDRVLTGIQQTRALFQQCWFDSEGCADGIAALSAYRKRWNSRTEAWTDQPEHDTNSNYADAFRQFGQATPSPAVIANNGQRRSRPRRSSNWRTA